MKYLAIIATIMSAVSVALAAPSSFVTGDNLFIQARVIACDSSLRYVEYSEVDDLGEVLVFKDIRLPVAGATSEEVASALSDTLEQRTGRRPISIRVLRVPEADHERAVMLMLQVYEFQSGGCPRLDPGLPDSNWRDAGFIASISHNKSFKADAVNGAAFGITGSLSCLRQERSPSIAWPA